MQDARAAILALLFFSAVCGGSGATQKGENPMSKVIQLIDELSAKVAADGETAQKAYHDYFEWCDDTAKESGFAIKDASSKKAKLEASIEDLSASIEASAGKIEDLAGEISKADADLKDATAIRDKEAANFAESEAELLSTIDTLSRALDILEKEMAKNPAFAQVDLSKGGLKALLQSLTAITDAAALSGDDQKKLVALVQQQSSDDDDDDAPGAPAAATYKGHSDGILEVIADLKEKAETELADLRKAEGAAKHNYEMLKSSLEQELSVKNKYMEEEKTAKAGAEESKATDEGDLEVTTKELATSNGDLATLQANCMTTAADHEASMAAMKEELATIAKAKKILEETMSGAVGETYSFVQVGSKATAKRHDVVIYVKKLAKIYRSAALAQLASRIAAEVKYGDDPFAKVKGLITTMIAKLEDEAKAAATEKAWCDEQMAKTETKKSELDDDVAKLTTKIDEALAKSTTLKEEIKVLQEELAALAKEQADMDKIRGEQNAAYVKAKADLELGLGGVRQALEVLRAYYGGAAASALLQKKDSETSFGAFMQQPAPPKNFEKSEGAGTGIIDILEVCESDFADNLAKAEQEEADSVSEYEKLTQENKVTKAAKDQDVKYKTQEAAGLDKAADELKADEESASAELASVMEYYGEVKDRCIAKPETYEDRAAKRAKEIAGLKDALSILEDEAALLQKHTGGKRRGHMRGAAAHIAVEA